VNEPASDTPDIRLDDQHPWPGLVSFTEADRVFFCGRQREIDDLARLVAQEPLTVLFGKSGLGKSSLLRAGLAPVLGELEFVPIYIRLNHDERMPPLAEQVQLRIEEAIAHGGIEGPAPVRGETLWEYFHKKGCDWWDAGNRLVKPVLIFDQFEELLTAGQEGEARAARTAAFLTELEDLVENRPPAALQKRFEAERGLARNYDLDRAPFRVVLSLREDYLADLESLREGLRSIMRSRYRLLPMSGDQALDVVLVPGGHLVDENVAIRIVDFVSASGRDDVVRPRTRKDIAPRQVEPALLSVVLQELNNRRLKSGADRITLDLVGEGHASEILEAFYERGLAGLDEPVRDFVVDSLLTASGARNRIAEEDALTRPGITETVIATLINRRIIQRQHTGSTKWLELTHDTLAAVVRRDRASRHQRRELALAAAREAEVRSALARTRRLVAAFAALLILVALGFVYAIVQRQRAAGMSRDLARSNTQLSTQEKDLLSTNQRLQARAEQDADAIVGRFRREITELTPGFGTTALADLGRLDQDVQAFDDSVPLRLARARAGALGAELLYARGYMQEGLAAADAALKSANDLAAQPSAAGTASANDLAEIRASAEYAEGRGLLVTGRLTDAARRFQNALDILSSTSAPDDPAARKQRLRLSTAASSGIGEANNQRGLFDDALRSYQKTLADLNKATEDLNKAPMDADIAFWKADTLRLLGSSREDADKSAEAVNYYHQARAIVNDMLDRDASKIRWQGLSALVSYLEAFSIMNDGSYSSVAALLSDALQTSKTIYNIDQTDLHNAFILGQVQRGQGMLALRQLQSDSKNDRARAAAREALNEVRRVSDRIRQKEPVWIVNRYQTAIAIFYLADTQTDQAQTRRLQSEARDMLEALVRDAPEQTGYIRSAAIGTYNLAYSEAEQKHYDAARALYSRAEQLIAQLPSAVRRQPRYQTISAYAIEMAGLKVYAATGRWSDAQRSYQEALRLYRDLLGRTAAGENESNVSYATELLGNAYLASNDEPRALSSYADAVKVYDDALKRAPDNLEFLQMKGETALRIAQQWRQRGRFDRAVASLRISAETGRKAFDLDPVQFNLYNLLERVSEEGKALTDAAAKAPAAGTSGARNSAIADAVDAVLKPVDTAKLFWPAGARENAAGDALEVAESQAWALPPLVPGLWLDLRPMELAAEKRRIAGDQKLKSFAADVKRVRMLPLSFYDGGFLYEAEVRRGATSGIVDYVRVGNDELVINGVSPPIHEFNTTHPLVLQTAQDAAAYLRFFCAAIQSVESTFRLLEGPQDLAAGSPSPTIVEQLGRLVVPLRVREESDGGWGATGTVRYGNNLFYAIFKLPANGIVDMRNDTPAVTDQPFVIERYDDGLRVESDYYIRHFNLSSLAQSASKASRWADAAQSMRTLVGLTRNKKFGDADANKRALVSQLIDLSWYDLLIKRYDEALSSAAEAHSLDAQTLTVEINRSHALLLTGRIDDALVLYRAHLNDKVGTRTWSAVVLEDLQTLEKAGVTSPAFTRVRQIVGESR
jgi:tetratricopeptide (TPR) repeat protein